MSGVSAHSSSAQIWRQGALWGARLKMYEGPPDGTWLLTRPRGSQLPLPLLQEGPEWQEGTDRGG